jgi:hypothetical protein
MKFRNIQSFNEFLNEAATTKWYDLVFNSHKNHNPNCDILEGHLDRNSLITYGIYVNGPEKGNEFMEYYSGPNYKPEAVGTSRSTSRMYTSDKIPAKYLNMWQELREIYENEYEGGKSTNESSRSIVDDARIKKEADKLFISRYPRVNPYDIKDIEFDGKDDIMQLIAIVKKRGEATDEEMMQDDYDYAVMKSMQKFGMFDSESFDAYINEAEEKDGNLEVQLTKSATGPFLKDLKTNGCPYRKVTDTKFIVDNTGKVRLAIRLVKERSGMRAITVTPTDETI